MRMTRKRKRDSLKENPRDFVRGSLDETKDLHLDPAEFLSDSKVQGIDFDLDEEERVVILKGGFKLGVVLLKVKKVKNQLQ